MLSKRMDFLATAAAGIALFAVLAIPFAGLSSGKKESAKETRYAESAEPTAEIRARQYLLVLREDGGFDPFLVTVDYGGGNVAVQSLPADRILPGGRTVEGCYSYAGATYLCDRLAEAGVDVSGGYLVFSPEKAKKYLDFLGGALVKIPPGRYNNGRTYTNGETVWVGGASFASALSLYGDEAVLRASVMAVIGESEEAFRANLIALSDLADTDLSYANCLARSSDRDLLRR